MKVRRRILNEVKGQPMQQKALAFAYVMLDDKQKVIKKNAWKIGKETNNRAELKAIIAGVHHLPMDATDVRIISDSQYALNTLSGKWQRKSNTDLFPIYDKIIKELRLNVVYEWVCGHDGNQYNEMCDKMCSEVAGMDLNAEFAKYKKK